MPLAEAIKQTLESLAHRSDEDPSWRAELRKRLTACRDEVRLLLGPGRTVDFGMGYGAVAQVPWVVVLNAGQEVREGHYPVLLFARDGSAAFLSLNQGTELRSRAAIRSSTEALRKALGEAPARFESVIDLRATTNGPRKYEAANVGAFRYAYADLPNDEQLASDLAWVTERSNAIDQGDLHEVEEPGGAWIFQSSPEQFDLSAALEALDDFTWLVNQYPKQIHEGDRLYLWETGSEAGVVAVAEITSEPAQLEAPEEERPFQRRPESFAGPRLRVRLVIDQVLEPRISRERVQSNPILSDLRNLRFANATNYPVTADQETELRRLIGLGDVSDSTPIALKVAPGRNASLWEDCLQNGYIRVGWDEVGDLRAFESRDELLSRFREEYPDQSIATAGGLWRLRSLKAGDFVIANRGTNHILGVGTVRNPGIDWADHLPAYKHVVHVDWDTSFARDIPAQSSWRWTIRTVGAALLAELLPELVAPRRARRYFVAITSPLYPDAWKRAKELGQWGAPKVEKALSAIRPGDVLLSWLGRKGFAGVAEAASEVHEVVETPANSWNHADETYPFRVDLRSIRDFAKPLYPEFPRGQNETFGLKTLQFAGRSMIEIQEWQYERILAELLNLNPDAEVPDPPPSISLPELAADLCLELTYLEDVDWLLEDKRQLVFYGPPGTGKTFVAEAFARWFTGSADRVETIQFHPSYAYEDFVEGIRPELDAADLRYRLAPGLLKRFAALAAADEGHRYVLVIDEINRANLARVFGELLYLLEYRSKDVTLPYSGARFMLPPNLYLIGTMNTADRSIALVDFALRRRFHFIEFPADATILRRWLQRHNPGMVEVAELLRWVNQQIDDHDFAIGFSYFMRDNLDEVLLERIWTRSVLPALDEFYFDNREKRARFGLEHVRKAVAGDVLDEVSDAADDLEHPEGIEPP